MDESGDLANAKLAQLGERLRSLRFSVKTGVRFEGQSLAIAACRARFQVERLCLAEEFFLVARFEHLDRPTLKDYSRKCFKYALQNRRIPLPWGWPAVHFATSYAVAMVSGVDSSLASDLEKSEPILRWWRGYEFPAIWDIVTGSLHYPQATSEIAPVWDHQRRVALEVLAPVA